MDAMRRLLVSEVEPVAMCQLKLEKAPSRPQLQLVTGLFFIKSVGKSKVYSERCDRK